MSIDFLHLTFIALAAFAVTATLLLALRPLAALVGLVDRPGGRKLHHGDVPLVGGVAMFVGVALVVAGGEHLGHNELMLLLTSAFMVFLGALDDRFDLQPRLRLLAHVSAAIVLVYGTRFSVPDLGNLLGFGVIPLGLLALPFTVVATVALINAFNMLDGLDGLAGGTALVTFIGIAAIAVMHTAPTSLLMSTSMIGALLAFLIFNMPAQFNRAVRVFMGDAGSTFIGFVLAGVGLTLVQPSRADIEPVVVLWLMPIPIFELFASTARRMLDGMPVSTADTGHFHHRFIRAGFSVRAVFVGYLLFSLFGVSVAVVGAKGGLPESLLGGGFCVLFGVWVLIVKLAPRLARWLPESWQRHDIVAKAD